MTDAQTDAPAIEARRRTNRDNGAEAAAGQLGDAAQSAEIAIKDESRSFGHSAEEAEGAARSGLDAAKDAARRYTDVTKRLADDSRRTTFEVANMWREGLAPVLAAQMDMQRSFEQLWRMATGLELMPSMRTAQPFSAFSAAPLLGLPATDVKETEQQYQLCAELPGLSADDVELEIRGDLLVLRGHKMQAREDARAAFRLSERVFGQFERSFPIPPDADRSGIEARFRDGLLRIDIPKQSAEGAQPSPIQIQS